MGGVGAGIAVAVRPVRAPIGRARATDRRRRELEEGVITRALGDTGLRTTSLGLGCAKLGSVLSTLSRDQMLALIQEALDLGIRHFDTADIYGQGDSERLLGEALGPHRRDVVVASKGGQTFSANQALAARFKTPLRFLAQRLPALKQAVAQRRARSLDVDFRPDTLARALERSLTRLRTDHLDIYYLHSPPVAVIAADDVFAKLESFRQQGMIRSWGISCDSIDQAEAAVARPGVRVIQMAIGDAPREAAVLERALAEGIGVVARHPAVQPGAAPQGRARRLGMLASRRGVACVLAGTTQISHLRTNVAAIDTCERAATAVSA
jgi:aryl-alcohol dehydrogenase-like predicted oxidoreductase